MSSKVSRASYNLDWKDENNPVATRPLTPQRPFSVVKNTLPGWRSQADTTSRDIDRVLMLNLLSTSSLPVLRASAFISISKAGFSKRITVCKDPAPIPKCFGRGACRCHPHCAVLLLSLLITLIRRYCKTSTWKTRPLLRASIVASLAQYIQISLPRMQEFKAAEQQAYSQRRRVEVGHAFLSARQAPLPTKMHRLQCIWEMMQYH